MYQLRSKSLLPRSSAVSSYTPDKSLRLGRLEGRVVGIAELVPGTQEELGRHTADIAELPRRASAVKVGYEKMSGLSKIAKYGRLA